MNNSEINRLGERLRQGNLTPETLSELDAYRRGFQPAIAQVVADLKNHIGALSDALLVQRPSKSTPSIVAKLVRLPSTKLTQIQDIAGLRIVLNDRYSQDVLAERVLSLFSESKQIDRRAAPSFGYRAVHLVVKAQGRNVEIQLRTTLQHAWAHQSELIADRLGHDFKYGKITGQLFEKLLSLSESIHSFEEEERALLAEIGGHYPGKVFDHFVARRQELSQQILAINSPRT